MTEKPIEISNNKNSIFIIPLKNTSLICKIENNEIRELGNFPKTADSKSIIINDEFICSIDSLITIFDIKGNLLQEIKSDFEATSLNSKNRIVYFGGKSREDETNPGEIFAILDLENKNYKIEEIKIPIDIRYGKAIDDILIHGNQLVLVDNIVYPKYLLEYEITNSKIPKHIKTYKLADNGTYEHIVKGDLNENWLVLLSSTIGRVGAADHIVVNGNTKNHTISTVDRESFNDICLIDNMLYVLANSTVYSLNLNNNISKEQMKKVDSRLNSINKIIRGPNNEAIIISEDSRYEKIN